MRLAELRLENLRCFEQLTLTLEPGWNLFVGANGAGKTSILEAAFMLSHGHSFRAGSRVGVQRDGANGYSVFGHWRDEAGSERRVGLARSDNRLVGRIDGETVPIGDLVRSCAVVCFEPGSHELIAGTSEVRRQFVDWGVFHVEHSFLGCWRRYQRALKQRNALLRSDASDEEFVPWEIELSDSGESLAAFRQDYLTQLQPLLARFAERLVPELGAVSLEHVRGWDSDQSLVDALRARRPRDRDRGHTTRGPHRSDWTVQFERAARREHYSRGQEKLVALACLLAQAQLHAQVRDHWPLFCFDDLASELDSVHQQSVVDVLTEAGAQVLVTGTEPPTSLRSAAFSAATFHVEHGEVARLI